MQVIIDEVVSNVRAIDGESALSPEILQRIIEACLRAVRDERDHHRRTSEERSTDGVLDGPGRE